MSCGSSESLAPEPSDFQTSNIRDRHDSPQVMRRKIQLPQTGVAFTECLQDALRGARGACTGNRYGEMPNSANLGGFALIVRYFQVPRVCPLPGVTAGHLVYFAFLPSHIRAKPVDHESIQITWQTVMESAQNAGQTA